jgi:aminocyclopropanecarboxylate oxidase
MHKAFIHTPNHPQLENHGVDAAVMEDVKRFVHGHYEEHLEAKFYASDLAKNLDAAPTPSRWTGRPPNTIHHRPQTNIADFPEILPPTRYADDHQCTCSTHDRALTYI